MTLCTTINELPPPGHLKRACQSAALIEAIRCDGTKLSRHTRIFRFENLWRAEASLGQVDNGQGDVSAIAFTKYGTLFCGIVKDVFRRARPAALELQAALSGPASPLPMNLRRYMAEPQVVGHGLGCTFCAWNVEGSHWMLPEILSNQKPLLNQVIPNIEVLAGNPELYRLWARENLGCDLPLAALRSVFEFQPLTPAILVSLGAKRSLEDMMEDIQAIDYPVA